MRLSSTDIRVIKEIVASELGQGAEIVLFGSRVDDTLKGGDVDLMITLKQCPVNPAFTSSLIAAKLERALQGRRVDVVLRMPDAPMQAIHEVALRSGVAL